MKGKSFTEILSDLKANIWPQALIFFSALFAFLPFLHAAFSWIAAGGFLISVFYGIFTGFSLIFTLFIVQSYRSKRRREKALNSLQAAKLNQKNFQTLFEGSNLPSWIIETKYQRVNWINNQLIEVWPYLNKAISNLLKDQLTPILESYKVSLVKGIQVKGIDLGKNGPLLSGVRVLEAGMDEVVFEAILDWTKHCDQKLNLEVETTGPDFDADIGNIRIEGILKFVMKPLVEKLPGFGAVLVSFKEEPKVDMDIDLLGGDITALPGVDGMISNIVKTSIMDMLVWPSRIVVPIIPGDYSHLECRPCGYIDVTLIEAVDFPKTDVFGKSDPFVSLYVRQKEGKVKRSTTKSNSKHPIWNEGFLIEVEDMEAQSLSVHLMDEETVEKSELIGAQKFCLSELEPRVPKELWLDLVENIAFPKEGKRMGRVHLQVVYIPYETEEDRINSPVKDSEAKKQVETEIQTQPENEAHGEMEAQREEEIKASEDEMGTQTPPSSESPGVSSPASPSSPRSPRVRHREHHSDEENGKHGVKRVMGLAKRLAHKVGV